MNTLILNCSAGMNVYVLSDNKVFSFEDSNQKKHTDELLVKVDELLNEAGLKVKDLNNICVCVGPGSFTGIRVAISVCKGLAIGTNAKIFVCSNFDLYSFHETDLAYYVLEGFSDNVYVRRFDGEKNYDFCVHFDEFVREILPNYKIVAENKKTQNMLKMSEIQCNIRKNHIINVFKEKIKDNDFVKLNEINPVYLRASQAEIERENRLKGEVNE